ncbi:retropepsin-like aspartic protease family protein [Aureimonas leprariae]|uniref:retropepsin-like aspartic protease family protein n=1 Tax=Plantimonas leprariae TaxID=2615207 RepID=UPI001387612F|nr:TIGR02281 family clan AA aspartic protease [Aureimonas leprariae]
MSKFIIVAVAASLFAISFPSAFQEYQKRLAAEGGIEALRPPAKLVEASAPPPSPPRPGTASLEAGPDGHFRADARLNGRSVPVLVDTGATFVAMNEATARRLGVTLAPSDFRYETETANGRTTVAVATLDRVQVGNVEVRDVEAAVTKGDGLNTVLLGMSFMKKLKRYEVADGRLNLVR